MPTRPLYPVRTNDRYALCAHAGNASTAAHSARAIGKMAVPFPNIALLAPTHTPDPSTNFMQQFVDARLEHFPGWPKERRCGQPPSNAAVEGGTWYSIPAAGECTGDAADDLAAQEGCTWAGVAARRVVHGSELLDAGLVTDPSGTHDVDLSAIETNIEAVHRAMSRHPGHERCCGC